MRNKFSTELFSSEYALPFVIMFVVALLTIAAFRRRRWVVLVWMPVLCWSAVLSCVALFLLLSGLNPPSGQGGGMPGQFLLSAALIVTPFVLVFCTALFLRPHREAFTKQSIALSLLLTGCLSAAPFALPRPHELRVQIRVLDSAHAPVPNANFTYSVFGGKGANYDRNGRTNAAGLFMLRVYPFEWGTITVSTPAAESKIRYDYWPEIMGGGKHNGIRLTAPGDVSHLEGGIGYVIGKTISANSNQVYEVLLQPR